MKKSNPRTDFSQRALAIVERATREMDELNKERKEELAKHAASSKGGKAGGVARAKSLTPKKRKAIAKKAAASRWNKSD